MNHSGTSYPVHLLSGVDDFQAVLKFCVRMALEAGEHNDTAKCFIKSTLIITKESFTQKKENIYRQSDSFNPLFSASEQWPV
jgi:hypothetical protein